MARPSASFGAPMVSAAGSARAATAAACGSGVVRELGRDGAGDRRRAAAIRRRGRPPGWSAPARRPFATVCTRRVAVDRLRDRLAQRGVADAQLHRPLVAVVGVDRGRAADRLDACVVAGREPGRDVDGAARERGFERARRRDRSGRRSRRGAAGRAGRRRPCALRRRCVRRPARSRSRVPRRCPARRRGREDVEREHRQRAVRVAARDLHRARIERDRR